MPKGTQFDLVTPIGTKKVTVAFVGKFNVYNILAAVSVGIVSGLTFETIVSAIEELEGVKGRFELVNCDQDFPSSSITRIHLTV